MAFDLKSITTGTVVRPPRIILLGTEKIGKSTFASESPSPIFLPIKGEEGIDAIDCAKFPAAENYDDVVEAINTLIESEHEYKTLVIDSSSALEPLIHAKVCDNHGETTIEKVMGGFGKGYVEAVYLWQQITQGLDILRDKKGMGVILIGHVTTKTFNDPLTESYSQWAWDVNGKAVACVLRWADCILFANSKTYTTKEEVGFSQTETKAKSSGDRYLYTQVRPNHPGGGRGVYGKLPYELPLSWDAWMSAINEVTSS